MLRYCANLKAIRYELTSLNRIVADKSHRVIVALYHLDDEHDGQEMDYQYILKLLLTCISKKQSNCEVEQSVKQEHVSARVTIYFF